MVITLNKKKEDTTPAYEKLNLHKHLGGNDFKELVYTLVQVYYSALLNVFRVLKALNSFFFPFIFQRQ